MLVAATSFHTSWQQLRVVHRKELGLNSQRLKIQFPAAANSQSLCKYTC